MKLKEIKKNGFYTDGEYVYKKEKNNSFTTFNNASEESKMFLKHGVEECGIYPFMLEKEVRLVEGGEEFFSGNIKVVDKKTLKIKAVKVLNRKENNKGCTLSHNGYEEFEKVINF